MCLRGKIYCRIFCKKENRKGFRYRLFRTSCTIQIAYAVSIHKAQGLEYKSVKVVITEDVDEQISHNIFYTAITRTTDKLKIYLSKETQKKLATKFVESNVGLKQAQIFAQHAGLKLKNKLSS